MSTVGIVPVMAKSRKTEKAAPDAPVLLKVDAKLKARWQDATKRLAAASQKGASAFDSKYETISEIVDAHPPLYLAGGFATATAFYASLGEDPRTVARNCAVAKFASPVEEAEYGPTKLDAAIALLQARAGGHPLGRLPVAFEKLRIPTKDGTKSLHDATLDELRAATRALSHPSAASTSPAVAAVTKRLTSPGLKSVRVRFAGGHFTLTNITPDALAELGRALSGLRLPKTEPKKPAAKKAPPKKANRR